MRLNDSGWKAEKYHSCIIMKADLIRLTCARRRNGELVNLNKYLNWPPINSSQQSPQIPFSQKFPTCHVTTRCVTSIVPAAPSCEPALPVSALHHSELCPFKRDKRAQEEVAKEQREGWRKGSGHSNRFTAACEQISSQTILHVKTGIHTLYQQSLVFKHLPVFVTLPGARRALFLQSAHCHEVNSHKSEGDILRAAARNPYIHVSDCCRGQNSLSSISQDTLFSPPFLWLYQFCQMKEFQLYRGCKNLFSFRFVVRQRNRLSRNQSGCNEIGCICCWLHSYFQCLQWPQSTVNKCCLIRKGKVHLCAC